MPPSPHPGKAALAEIVAGMDEGVTETTWGLNLFQSGTVCVAMEQWPDPDNRFGSGYLAAHVNLYNIQGSPDGIKNRRYLNAKHIERTQPKHLRSIAAYAVELEADVQKHSRRAAILRDSFENPGNPHHEVSSVIAEMQAERRDVLDDLARLGKEFGAS